MCMTMLPQQPDIEEAQRKNIIEMALAFTGMMRIFSKRSKTRILGKLDEIFSQLPKVQTSKDYQELHRSFCNWFTQEIWNAERKLSHGKIQPSQKSSYGQAAKVLDIASKVFVYYCARPNPEVARRIFPFLNGAVDTPILQYLRRLPCATARISATTIKEIDQCAYHDLQALMLAESGRHHMHPVQFDDVLWRQLNRKDGRDTQGSSQNDLVSAVDQARE